MYGFAAAVALYNARNSRLHKVPELTIQSARHSCRVISLSKVMESFFFRIEALIKCVLSTLTPKVPLLLPSD